ncbi:MAG: C4-dicarboxylate transporter DcuC [Alphaproteobacteria bacterium]|jgi:DcuC family C4-dicarboxylate transporter|nr:C4-dicarboxylate transporter DcuC [Alphaproteobacteria bacterium]
MNILITLLVVVLVAYGMIKQYNPQAVLMTAGLIFFVVAYFTLGVNPIAIEKSNGFLLFDIWDKFSDITNNRLASIGLTLVSIAGVSTYLNKIGSSASLIKVTSKFILKISNPYLLLFVSLIVVSVLYIFITGATSLSLLLMATVYPIFRNAGISAKTMAATIVIPTSWEYGPGQINATVGAQSINMDTMTYVIQHQTPLQIMVVLAVAIINVAYQRYMDKKDNFNYAEEKGKFLMDLEKNQADKEEAPAYYSLFPLIPFVLLIMFSGLFFEGYAMSIPVAMMTTITVCMIIEMIRFKSVKKSFSHFQAWIEGTGMIFASVITLMVAAEFFAKGLESVGAISSMLNAAEQFALPPMALSIFFCLFILLTAFITGSGNAPVLAFVSLVPVVSEQFSINPLLILVPILMAAGIGRSMSPVAGVIITVAGIAKLTPFEIVKRTSVPVITSLLITLVYSFIRYS